MILSVIIPSYNEPTVSIVLKKLYDLSLPKNFIKEIILVDDGSNDQSIIEVENKIEEYPELTLLKHQKNLGKGAAIKTGLSICRGDIIIIQDADLEYNPTEIIKVINPIIKNETLVCYGSRHLDKSLRKKYFFQLKKHLGHSFTAFLGGRLITLVCDILFFANLTDVLTCYKAFSSSFIKGIELRCNGFDLETELTAKILKKTKIKEVAINYFPRSKNEGKKILMIDGLKSLATLIKYRFVK